MNALLLYSDFTGKKSNDKKIKKIAKKLKNNFDLLTIYKCLSKDDFKEKCLGSCGVFDVLIVAGGDGTMNLLINNLKHCDKTPTIGYIPTGTLNDAGKNLNIKNVNDAIRAIEKGMSVVPYVGSINGELFLYMAAVGRFSDISYTAKTNRRGKRAYYSRAFKDAFSRKFISFSEVCATSKKDINTPFFLVMNGKKVAGFNVNKHGNILNDELSTFYAKSSFLGGLANFFFHLGLSKGLIKELNLEFENEMTWCLDGEPYVFKNVKISIQKSNLNIFSNPYLDYNR